MKKTIRIFIFIVVLALLLLYANSLLKPKYGDGIYDLKKYHQLKNDTVDVLILGSSHAFESFNTGTLWDEYGISSFVLGGAAQPMWNTYYFLKEALETQTPRLIVLEGYSTVFLNEYAEESNAIKNTYGLKWSKNKVEAIKASIYPDLWNDYLWDYTRYHTRYKELSKEDFFVDQGSPLYKDWKGFGCNMETNPLETVDVSGVSERSSMSPKTEEYYRAVLDLAKEKGIPVMVVISPYAGIYEEQQMIYNTAGDIAEEKGAHFINCNLCTEEIGLDYSTDAADDNHLNYKGNTAFSKYIGGIMKDNYDIPDRRGDSSYDTWKRNAAYIRRMIQNQELKEKTDLRSFMDEAMDDDYRVFVMLSGKTTTADERYKGLLNSCGIMEPDSSGIWYVNNRKVLWNSDMGSNELFIRTKYHDILLKKSESDGMTDCEVIIDKTEYDSSGNRLMVVVFDDVTQSIVTAITD